MVDEDNEAEADDLETRSGCLLGWIVALIRKAGAAPPPPYDSRRWLVTKAERSFLGVLEQALGGRYRICPKVRLSDVLKVKRGTEKRGSWQNRIQSKHLDFVLCTHDTVEIVAAVELDDASHQRPDRRDRDKFLDAAMHAAGIPLVRVVAARNYVVADVARMVDEAINPPAPPQVQ